MIKGEIISLFFALTIVFSLVGAAQAVSAVNANNTVASNNLTDAQKTQIADAINTKFGTNMTSSDVASAVSGQNTTDLISSANAGGVSASTITSEDLKALKTEMKEIKQNANLTTSSGKSVAVNTLTDKQTEIIANKITARTGLNISYFDLNNKSVLVALLSNGRNAIVKIMPDTASQTALTRLGLKVCNETNNCTIVLKETGTGNDTKLTYEINAEKKAKLLFLFSVKEKLKAQVSAETGQIAGNIEKPWWAFLAKEEE